MVTHGVIPALRTFRRMPRYRRMAPLFATLSRARRPLTPSVDRGKTRLHSMLIRNAFSPSFCEASLMSVRCRSRKPGPFSGRSPLTMSFATLSASCDHSHQSDPVSRFFPCPYSDWNPAIAVPHWKPAGKSRCLAAKAGAASIRAETAESATRAASRALQTNRATKACGTVSGAPTAQSGIRCLAAFPLRSPSETGPCRSPRIRRQAYRAPGVARPRRRACTSRAPARTAPANA